MSFFTWLFGQTNKEQQQQQTRVRPQLELLEDRITPALDVFQLGDSLLITLTQTNDHAFLRVNGSNIEVDDDSSFSSPVHTVATDNINFLKVYNGFQSTNQSVTFVSGAFDDGLTVTDIETVGIDATFDMAANRNMVVSRFDSLSVSGDVAASGSGTVEWIEGDRIQMASGSSLTTVAGDITLAANTTGTATGSFVGIDLNGADITTTDGSISLTGHGGDTGERNHGIRLDASSSIVSAGTGNLTLDGTGRGSTRNSSGVVVRGDSLVSSVTGDIDIDGRGIGGGGDGHKGVLIFTGSVVESTGTGPNAAKIFIDGQGSDNATATANNYGVQIDSIGTTGPAQIRSVDGDVTITGIAGNGSTERNIGVLLDRGAQVHSTGTAIITVTGTGGDGTALNYGVNLAGDSTKVASTSGAINIIGQGGAGTAKDNHGVFLLQGGVIESLGTATVTVAGTAGDGGTTNNHGVQIFGADTQIRSVDGKIDVSGQGGDGTGFNTGVILNTGGKVLSSGDAEINVDGTGGAGGSSNHGVFLVFEDSDISSVSGNISITGTGAGEGSTNRGVWVSSGGEISSTGAASITIDGTGSVGASGNHGVLVSGGSAVSSFVAGNIQITGRGNGTTGSNYGVHLQSSGTNIRSTGTGAITIEGFGGDGGGSNNGVILESSSAINATGTAPVSITGTGGEGDDGTNQGVFVSSTAQITTGASPLTITGTGGTGNGDANSGVVIQSVGTLISAGAGGTISITGTGTQGESTDGVRIQVGAQVLSTGEGAAGAPITIVGTTTGDAGSGTSSDGVHLNSSGTLISSKTGDINISGTTSTGTNGVFVNAGAVVESTGTDAIAASITINGTGPETGGSPDGVIITGTGSRVSSIEGEISVDGTSGDDGVQISGGAKVQTTGTSASANIIINGTSTGTGPSPIAALVDGTNTEVTTVAGDISITGNGTDSDAIIVRNDAVVSTNSGEVSFTGDVTGSGEDITVNNTSVGSATATGDVLLTGGADFNVSLAGIAPGQFDQLAVTGAVDLTDVTLNVSLNFTPNVGDTFVIIDNDGTDAVTGTFNDLPEASFFDVNGTSFQITYQGGADSNDVVLTANHPPQADAGGPYTISEGDPLTLNGTNTSDPDDDPLTYRWDLNGDGTFEDATGPQPTLSWEDLVALGIDDDGQFTVALQVTDDKGAVSTDTTSLTINNTPPSLTITGNASTNEGSPFTLELSADDPGEDTITEWFINWGDGSDPDNDGQVGERVSGNPDSVDHVYADGPATHTILATATDEDGTYDARGIGAGAGGLTGSELQRHRRCDPGLRRLRKGLCAGPRSDTTRWPDCDRRANEWRNQPHRDRSLSGGRNPGHILRDQW